jgi:hypothetical protein
MRKKDERWKASRKDGFHVLRHTYASVILEAGESVVTLDYYAYFMPEAGGKGRGSFDPDPPQRPQARRPRLRSELHALRTAALQDDYSEPIPPLEDDVQTGANNPHQGDRKGVSEHPVQLRHVREVHPVDRPDQRRSEQNGRPRRDLLEVVYRKALTCGDAVETVADLG